ncbi:MAG: hypothetical protein ABI840_09325 [bacterium]
MGQKVLVEKDIQDGENLIQELKKKVLIKDAIWLYDEDESIWKLIISSPEIKTEGPKYLYTEISKILRKLKSHLLFSFIQVLDPNSNLIKMLRSSYEVRNRMFGNVPIDDVHIYILDGHQFNGLKNAS